MRLVTALKGDIRYQAKYGFYFLYIFISIVYIVILVLCPVVYKQKVASVIILTDPAMLGIFFIGAIWLLEKGEGIHGFWEVSPLRPIEYILSKAISLASISTISALIILVIGLQVSLNYLLICVGVFVGAVTFTILGLYVATFSRSVNHYMLLATPLSTLLMLPPLLATFGYSFFLFDLLPSMALWRIITAVLNMKTPSILWFLNLTVWLIFSLYFVSLRLPIAMQIKGEEKI